VQFRRTCGKKIFEINKKAEETFGIKIPIRIKMFGEKTNDDVANPFRLLSPILEVEMAKSTEEILQLIEPDFPIRSNDPRHVTERYSQIMEALGEVIEV